MKIKELRGIKIYIYGERYNKHHGMHVYLTKGEEECNYGFDGKPIGESPALSNKTDRKAIEKWILSRRDKLEKAWEDVNNGIDPGMID